MAFLDKLKRMAIQVTVDHLRDRACTCYLPYRIIDGRVVTDELFATEPVERLFTDKTTFIARFRWRGFDTMTMPPS